MRRIAVVALAAVLASGACSTPGASGEVRVLVAGDPEELAAFRAIVDAYRAAGGGPVRLEEVAERDDLVARLSTSIAAGDPPDAFLLNYRYYGQFEAAGALQPLQSMLDTSDVLDAGSFVPAAMNAFRDDGVQTCIPLNASSLVLYYNADLFAAAGLAPPRDDWTWDEMVAAARALTRDVDGDETVDVWGLGVEPQIIRLAPFVWSSGGSIMDEGAPSRIDLGSVRAALATQAFLDLRGLHEVVPTEEDAESIDLETRFLGGGLAMLMESRKVVPTFRTIEDFGWDVAALPRFGRRPVSILHSDAFCMTARAAEPDAAWTFLEFALGPEGQAIAAQAGRTVPSLRSVAASQDFLTPGGSPSNSRVFLAQLDGVRSVPNVASWPQIEDAVNALLEEAFYDPSAGPEAPELIAAIQRATAPLFAQEEA